MAKKGNNRALAPSAGEGWDAWGAACGFSSWAKAAEAIGITTAQMVTIRKKAPRKTIRLAMDGALSIRLRRAPEGFLPNGTRVMWQSSNGAEFPATIVAYNPSTYDAVLDDGCWAKGFSRHRFFKMGDQAVAKVAP